MRFDIEDAILGMYDSIERAREAHRLQQGIPIREHGRESRLESTWIRLQLSFVTISLMRDSILMRSMTKDACAHYRAGSVPPRTGTCWRLTMANS